MKNKNEIKKLLAEIKTYDYLHFTTPSNTNSLENSNALDGNSSRQESPDLAEINTRIRNYLESVYSNYDVFPKDISNTQKSFINKIKKYLINKLYNYALGQKVFNDNLRHLLLGLTQKSNEQQKIIEMLNSKVIETENLVAQNNTSTNSKLQNISDRLVNLENLVLNKTSNFKKGRFFAQFAEDKWIVENLEIPEKGTFIDVGASDGIVYSNTYYFELLGWEGICIEPDPRSYEKAKKYRQNVLPYAVSNSNESTITFNLSSVSPDWSGINTNSDILKSIVIETKKLEDILSEEAIESIDILSIDTEGSELDVWESFDYKKYKPKIVIIEYLSQDKINDQIKILFKKLPYNLVHTTKSNYIYTYQK